MGDNEPDVSVQVDVDTDDTLEDENDNGVPDVVETGQALERATQAQQDAEDAQETAENAGVVAEVAAEASFDAHDRLNQMEVTMGRVVETMQQMSDTLVGLRELVTANAEATANQLQVQMRGPQPDDEPPAANHWLGRKLF